MSAFDWLSDLLKGVPAPNDDTPGDTGGDDTTTPATTPELDNEDSGTPDNGGDDSATPEPDTGDGSRQPDSGGDDDTPPTDLESQLHSALVRLDGRLADPSALPFDRTHLTDTAALESTIDALLEDRPNLSARAVSGDAGQGNRGTPPANEPVDLIALMRDN